MKSKISKNYEFIVVWKRKCQKNSLKKGERKEGFEKKTPFKSPKNEDALKKQKKRVWNAVFCAHFN